MKRFLILVTVAILTTCLAAGCVGGVKTYTDSGQTISIGANQEFVIALGSNPTTGYSWQESHDEIVLEFMEKTYKPGEAAKQGVVGAGGIDYFRFKSFTEFYIIFNYIIAVKNRLYPFGSTHFLGNSQFIGKYRIDRGFSPLRQLFAVFGFRIFNSYSFIFYFINSLQFISFNIKLHTLLL